MNSSQQTQKYACRDKSFVAKKICLSPQNIVFFAAKYLSRQITVATNLISSRQAYFFCRDKHVFCRDKSMLVETKLLSRQTRVLSRQTHVLSRQTHVSRDKCFVATKITCGKAPANDNEDLVPSARAVKTMGLYIDIQVHVKTEETAIHCQSNRC